jgi:hypothetical protein
MFRPYVATGNVTKSARHRVATASARLYHPAIV